MSHASPRNPVQNVTHVQRSEGLAQSQSDEGAGPVPEPIVNTAQPTPRVPSRWSFERIADSIATSLSSVVYNATTEGLSKFPGKAYYLLRYKSRR